MRSTGTSVASLTGPFVSQATSRGIRAPVRLLDHDTRAWPVADRGDETLFVDEYGDAWWGRSVHAEQARVTRACWPEEFRTLHPAIARSIERIMESETASR